MQDRYVGDIGDYAKYGLLRSLTGAQQGTPDLSLGVHWYLACPRRLGELTRSQVDGMHVGYLNQPSRYRPADPDLYDVLHDIVRRDDRRLSAIEESQILGANTRWFGDLLDFSDMPALSPAGRERREEMRRRWHAAAMQNLTGSDIIFADPDNGLENGSTRLLGKDGPKFAALAEAGDLARLEASLVIYQHHPREALNGYVDRRLHQLAGVIPDAALMCVTVAAFGVRHFFVAAQSRHASALRERAGEFCTRFAVLKPTLRLA